MKQNTIIHSKLTRNLFITFALLTTLNAEYIRDDSKNVVLDTEAELMWQDEMHTSSEREAYFSNRERGKVLSWQGAMNYCQNLNLAGYDDWYLPEEDKLKKAYKNKKNFKKKSCLFYWSATTQTNNQDTALVTNFKNIWTNNERMKTLSSYVRCVRDLYPFNTKDISIKEDNSHIWKNLEHKIDILKSSQNGTVTYSQSKSNLTYKPNKNFFGKDSFTFLYDGSEYEMGITVKAVNDKPIIKTTLQNKIIESGEIAVIDYEVSDVEDTNLSIDAYHSTCSLNENENKNKIEVDKNNNQIRVISDKNFIGNLEITIQVTDNDGGTTLSKEIIEVKQLIKGYLQEDLDVNIIDGEDSYEDTISKDTFMVINRKDFQIIEPKEFDLLKLTKIPSLGYHPQQREINLTPIFQRNKNLLSFKLNSKVILKELVFDKRRVEILTKEVRISETNISKKHLNYYQSGKKKIRNFSKIYPLILKGKNFQISYECKFDKDKNVSCKQKMKREI